MQKCYCSLYCVSEPFLSIKIFSHNSKKPRTSKYQNETVTIFEVSNLENHHAINFNGYSITSHTVLYVFSLQYFVKVIQSYFPDCFTLEGFWTKAGINLQQKFLSSKRTKVINPGNWEIHFRSQLTMIFYLKLSIIRN